MCRRVVEAGIPLWRAFCGIRTLHPQIAASAYVWRARRNRGGTPHRSARDGKDSGLHAEPAHRGNGSPVARFGGGWTMPVPTSATRSSTPFASKAALTTSRCRWCFRAAKSIASAGSRDRPGGFTEAEIAGLTDVAEMLTVIVETQTHRRIVRALLDTYVGHRTGERVLSGAVKRGDGETIRAGHLVLRFARLHEFVGRAAARCAARSAQRVFRNHGERRLRRGRRSAQIYRRRDARDFRVARRR